MCVAYTDEVDDAINQFFSFNFFNALYLPFEHIYDSWRILALHVNNQC